MVKTELISNRVCPYAHRAWLALFAKDVPFTFTEYDLVDKPQRFTSVYKSAIGADVTSDGKVPVLIDGDDVLCESGLIVQYLDERYPEKGNKLFRDPIFNFKSRMFVDQFGNIFCSKFSAFTRGPSAETKAELIEAFAKIEKMLSADKKFLVDNYWGYAEVMCFPWMCSDRMAFVRSLGLDLDAEVTAPCFFRISKELESLQPFKSTLIGGEEFSKMYIDITRRRAEKAK